MGKEEYYKGKAAEIINNVTGIGGNARVSSLSGYPSSQNSYDRTQIGNVVRPGQTMASPSSLALYNAFLSFQQWRWSLRWEWRNER